MGCSSSPTALAQVPSMGCSASGTDCSSVGPPWVHRSWQEPAPARALHGLTASFGHIYLLQCWVLHGLQAGICSTTDLHGLQGHSLPHHGLQNGLQGNPCSGTWSTSSPSFSTDLGVYRVGSLTYSHSSLPGITGQHFFRLFKYIITDALPPLLTHSALASGGSILELAVTGSTRHGGSFWHLLTEATPAASPLPKPCHANPTQSGSSEVIPWEQIWTRGAHPPPRTPPVHDPAPPALSHLPPNPRGATQLVFAHTPLYKQSRCSQIKSLQISVVFPI